MKLNYFAVAAFVLLPVLSACNKHDSHSDSGGGNSAPAPAPTPKAGELVVSPNQANVPISQGTQLQATIDGKPVNATWTVSSSSMGTLNSTTGSQVIYTGKSAGTVSITASVEEQAASCTLVILAPGQNPNPNPNPQPNTPATFPENLNLYNDAGGILGNPDVLLFTGGGLTIDEKTGGAAEGSKYLEAVSGPGGFWGISLDKNNKGISANASRLAGGSLRFSIRLQRDLGPTEFLNINLSDKSGRTVSVPIGKDPSCSGSVAGSWLNLAIPISNYQTIDLAHLTVPFAIAVNSPSNVPSLTFDIDNVRWTEQGATLSMSANGVAAAICQ